MNTPAHAVFNLLLLGRQDRKPIILPVLIGSILPDIPLFGFYLVQKLILKQPESYIWGTAYYQSSWQNLFATVHSIPLLLFGAGLCYWRKSQIGLLFFNSMLLHSFGDLPLHHDDGHSHFFPFSNWKFISPISYWDPKHYGNIISVLEILGVAIACFILWRCYQSRLGKGLIATVGVIYLLFFAYVLTVWAS
jgi:hypothetical protein